MKNILYSLLLVSAFASCTESYNIQGSSLTVLDGSKLYLKVMDGKDMRAIDSCDVVHGKFRFAGILDTTQMAFLCIDDKSLMPIVVERGDIKVRIDDTRKVSGSPLNDILYVFLDEHDRLSNEMEELEHRYNQMILEGIDEDEINRKLTSDASTIAQREDSLVTTFVVDNFENILGSFFFRQLYSVPQIEHIWMKAPETFKRQPDISEFYQRMTSTANPALEDNTTSTSAQEIDDATIQDILNGKKE